jgi:hypothetical protein
MTTPDNTSTQTQPTASPTPDPIDQARQLINMFSNGGIICQTTESSKADDATLVLAAVGIAIAAHVSRLADAVEAHNQFIAQHGPF